MNHAAIQRIRASFAQVATHLGPLVDRFYQLLFERLPDARKMFPDNMARQKKHLLAALATVARNLHEVSVLEAPLRELGARHVAYGAQPEHYPVVRDALLDALAETASSAWNETLRADWKAALDLVAGAMLRGAVPPTRTGPAQAYGSG